MLESLLDFVVFIPLQCAENFVLPCCCGKPGDIDLPDPPPHAGERDDLAILYFFQLFGDRQDNS